MYFEPMFYQPGEEGQGLAEYGLILVLLAVVVIALVTVFGTQVQTLFSEIASGMAAAAS